MSLKARRQSIWMDRAVGLTTPVVGTGGLVYGLNKLLRALRRFLRITFGDVRCSRPPNDPPPHKEKNISMPE